MDLHCAHDERDDDKDASTKEVSEISAAALLLEVAPSIKDKETPESNRVKGKARIVTSSEVIP